MENGSHTSGASPTRVPKTPAANADNGVDNRAELNFFAQDTGIPCECAIPPGIADDGYRMIALGIIVGIVQRAADEGVNAKQREVIAGHELHGDGLSFIAAINVAVPIVAQAEDAGDVREYAVALSKLAEEGMEASFVKATSLPIPRIRPSPTATSC